MRQGRWSMGGNFSAVIDGYLGSPQFMGLAESSQGNWRRLLLLAQKVMGELPVEQVRPSIVQAFLDGLSDFPGKQNSAKASLKAVEKWAIVRDMLPHPITIGVQVVGLDGGHE